MATKMKMVMKGGKKVPAFAADGKGKMMMGGTKKMKIGGMRKMQFAGATDENKDMNSSSTSSKPTATPSPSPSPTPKAPSQTTFAETYKANLVAGLTPKKARKEAEREMGFVKPKERINPNSVIEAVGNTAAATANVIGARKNPGSNFKKGGQPLPKASKGKIVTKGLGILSSILGKSKPARKAKIIAKKGYRKVKPKVTQVVKDSAGKIITGALFSAGAHAYNTLTGRTITGAPQPAPKPLPKPVSKTKTKPKVKAMYGGSMSPKKMQTGGGTDPYSQAIKRKMIENNFNNARKIIKGKASKTPKGKI